MLANRRRFLTTSAAGFGAAWCGITRAEDWPNRPIRMTIGYPPGGSADGVARPLLAPMGKALGQPLVMDYRPGAAGATAAEFVTRMAPDGYSLTLVEGGVMTALPYLRKLNFDPVKGLQPLGMAAVGGVVIVAHPSLGIATVQDLIKAAKAGQGELAYGTSGIGGAQHLAAEYFQATAGIKMLHVPYKGGAPAMTDLLGGQIKLLFSSMTPAIPFVKESKITAIGVTSPARSSSLPQVPTVAEQGMPGFDSEVWLAVAGPRGLGTATVEKISAVVSSATSNPAVQAELRAQGYEPVSGGPDAVAQRIQKEGERWARIIRDAHITLEA